jgi:hypothetical protein
MSEPAPSAVDVPVAFIGAPSAGSLVMPPLTGAQESNVWNGAVNGDTARTRSPAAHSFFSMWAMFGMFRDSYVLQHDDGWQISYMLSRVRMLTSNHRQHRTQMSCRSSSDNRCLIPSGFYSIPKSWIYSDVEACPGLARLATPSSVTAPSRNVRASAPSDLNSM